jgi:hypothetical protein
MTSQVNDRRASDCHDPSVARAVSSESRMGSAVRAVFVVVAFVNLLPVYGAVGAVQLEALYGLPLPDPEVVLLLRHRALLFGLVAGLLLAAAFVPALRFAGAMMGLGSMLSFVVLVSPPGAHAAALQRVFWVDVIAAVLLLAALWLEWRSGGRVRHSGAAD